MTGIELFRAASQTVLRVAFVIGPVIRTTLYDPRKFSSFRSSNIGFKNCQPTKQTHRCPRTSKAKPTLPPYSSRQQHPDSIPAGTCMSPLLLISPDSPHPRKN